jgi:hypothetical protein
LLQHEVILLKSCYPNSHIMTGDQLDQYKTSYLSMRSVMDQHPEKLFVLLTPPPLNPAGTNPEAALRARQFANWMGSAEYLNGHPNVVVFDLFDYLAEEMTGAEDADMLKAEYRDGADSHPNTEANQTIGPLLVDYVIQSIEMYRGVWDR